MTPNDINVLLHCHTIMAEHPRAKYPAVQGSLQGLETNGLIFLDDENFYRTTPKGRAHVAQLCELAWPTEAWVTEKNEIILIDGF